MEYLKLILCMLADFRTDEERRAFLNKHIQETTKEIALICEETERNRQYDPEGNKLREFEFSALFLMLVQDGKADPNPCRPVITDPEEDARAARILMGESPHLVELAIYVAARKDLPLLKIPQGKPADIEIRTEGVMPIWNLGLGLNLN